MKHTPGPWKRAKDDYGNTVVTAKGICIEIGSERIDQTGGFAEVEANARLIAAAPEYASEVEEAIGWLSAILETNTRSADEVFEILAEMRSRFMKLNAKSTGGV